ncbi:MAG: hypothetical protein WEC14_06670 [Chloroflexota bacterium]
MTHRPLLGIAAVLVMVVAACAGAPGGASPATSPAGPAAGCEVSPEPAQADVTAWAGDQRPTVYPQIIDPGGTLSCGPNRLMFSFLDASSVPIASPDRSVQVALYDLGRDAEAPAVTAEGRFIWAIEGQVGIYVADVDLPTAGLWGAEFTTAVADAAPEIIRVPFDVRAARTVIGVGDRAPASDTPTLDDVGGDVARLSTDEDPVEAFYTTSIAEAVAAKEPFVVAFATPKFCATAQCGPTLDRLKPIAAAHPGVTFINVEPYQLQDVDGQLQPVLTDGQLTPATATDEWRLPSEPWVFVVDRDGIVRGSFMLIFGDEELDAAVRAIE